MFCEGTQRTETKLNRDAKHGHFSKEFPFPKHHQVRYPCKFVSQV